MILFKVENSYGFHPRIRERDKYKYHIMDSPASHLIGYIKDRLRKLGKKTESQCRVQIPKLPT